MALCVVVVMARAVRVIAAVALVRPCVMILGRLTIYLRSNKLGHMMATANFQFTYNAVYPRWCTFYARLIGDFYNRVKVTESKSI